MTEDSAGRTGADAKHSLVDDVEPRPPDSMQANNDLVRAQLNAGLPPSPGARRIILHEEDVTPVVERSCGDVLHRGAIEYLHGKVGGRFDSRIRSRLDVRDFDELLEVHTPYRDEVLRDHRRPRR